MLCNYRAPDLSFETLTIPARLAVRAFVDMPPQQPPAYLARLCDFRVVKGRKILVAGELKRRWNATLQAMHRIEGEIAAIVAAKPPPLGERERQRLMQLGADLELAWSHPAATAATQVDLAHSVQRDRGARRRSHQHGSALAGRRPHCTARQVEIECCRPAPLAAA